MAKFVRVTAPYVTLRVRDAVGAFVVKGMYKGGTVPSDDVEPESLKHHLDSDLVEEFTAAATPEGDQPKPGAAQNPPVQPETAETQGLVPVKADETAKVVEAKKADEATKTEQVKVEEPKKAAPAKKAGSGS